MTANPAPSGEDTRAVIPISVSGWARLFTRWDVLAVLLILGLLVFLGEASRHLFEPLAVLEKSPPSLDPRNLPEYAARTTLRMLIAMVLSLLFTFTYATLAAKSKRAERLLVPLLDILQSVPILGFISVTVVFFMALAPGRVLGAEYAAIFAIFTSQAWNMAFSFYQSLRTIPTELEEAARNFRLSPWMKFWRLDVPFAMPQLIWNMMMSMSGSWFFVVASEAISVGNTTITLPGVGSYIALAIEHQDLKAVAWAIATMLIVILIYDQLLFRPLVAWADRFRFEQEAGVLPPRSWVFDVLRRSRIVERLTVPFGVLWRLTLRPRRIDKPETARRTLPLAQSRIAFQFGLIVVALAAAALWQIVHFVIEGITLSDVGLAILLGFATLARVTVLIAIASVIWVPVGVWVGTRPHAAHLVQPVAQFLAAFPANLLFPVAVSLIVAWRLDPEYLAQPADDPRHAMVHSVQRHCRSRGDPGGAARRRRELARPRLAVVATYRAAGGAALLRDRKRQHCRPRGHRSSIGPRLLETRQQGIIVPSAVKRTFKNLDIFPANPSKAGLLKIRGPTNCRRRPHRKHYEVLREVVLDYWRLNADNWV